MNDITSITTTDNDVALIAVPNFDAKGYAAAVFEPFKKQIAKAKREAGKDESYDITTGAGMGRAKELRAMFRDIRTSVENVRKDRKAPIIEAGKLLDARAAEIKADVEQFEDKYDREIKAEEQRKEDEKQRKLAEERARVEAIQNRIDHIRGAASRLASADSTAVQAELNTWTMLRLEPSDYQEYLEDALTAVNTTIDQLTSLLAKAQEREAEARRIAEERAELVRMKAEQEAREKAEREAAAERERLAKIERDKAEAERRAAAAEKAALEEKMAEMQRQMEAMQRALQPAAAPVEAPAAPVVEAPLIEEGAPTVMGVDFGTEQVDEALPGGQYYSTTTFRDDGKPILCNADGTRSIFCDVDEGGRPDNGEILDVLAAHYGESPATILGWLRILVKEVAL
jgi:hypothetical protein